MNRTAGYKRKFPTKKYPTPKKSMVLPYGKNIRYKKPTRRTKKATQQINSKQFISQTSQAGRVATATDSEFVAINWIQQGSTVEECTGTSVYVKSLYVQGQVSITPTPDEDGNFISMRVNNGCNFPGNRAPLSFAHARNVRIVVLLDRAPNGTVPKLDDVYLVAPIPPCIKNITGADAGGATMTPCVTLDPDKSRRFKVLMNQIVQLNYYNDQIVHFEKYIPLNMMVTMTGNNVANIANAKRWLITNGVYIQAFTDIELEATDQVKWTPRWVWHAKLRFEP